MDDPGTFFDAFARVYDARLRNQADETDGQLAGDVAFYRDLAERVDGPALEVGVGTGRVYLELLESGCDVDGIDVSAAMLERLRAKAATRDLDPSVRTADVTDLEPDRAYGLVYAPARAINHLITLDAQRTALRNVRAALRPDGRFACNTFVPSYEVVAEEYGTPREETVSVDGTEYRVVSETTLEDAVEQTARYHRELYAGGELLAERATPLALVPKRQFELLFDLAGFETWTVYGGFERAPLESTEQEMVWVAHA